MVECDSDHGCSVNVVNVDNCHGVYDMYMVLAPPSPPPPPSPSPPPPSPAAPVNCPGYKVEDLNTLCEEDGGGTTPTTAAECEAALATANGVAFDMDTESETDRPKCWLDMSDQGWWNPDGTTDQNNIAGDSFYAICCDTGVCDAGTTSDGLAGLGPIFGTAGATTHLETLPGTGAKIVFTSIAFQCWCGNGLLYELQVDDGTTGSWATVRQCQVAGNVGLGNCPEFPNAANPLTTGYDASSSWRVRVTNPQACSNNRLNTLNTEYCFDDARRRLDEAEEASVPPQASRAGSAWSAWWAVPDLDEARGKAVVKPAAGPLLRRDAHRRF